MLVVGPYPKLPGSDVPDTSAERKSLRWTYVPTCPECGAAIPVPKNRYETVVHCVACHVALDVEITA